jgi:hypothetical protein
VRAWRAARRSIGHYGFALGSGSAVLGGHAVFPVVAGPWWADFLLAALGLLALCLRIVFPQDSPDKLAWWRDRRRAGRRRRRRAVGPCRGPCDGQRGGPFDGPCDGQSAGESAGDSGDSSGACEHEQTPGRTSCRGSVAEFPSRLGGRSLPGVLPGDLLPVGVKLHLKRVGDGLGVGQQRVHRLQPAGRTRRSSRCSARRAAPGRARSPARVRVARAPACARPGNRGRRAGGNRLVLCCVTVAWHRPHRGYLWPHPRPGEEGRPRAGNVPKQCPRRRSVGNRKSAVVAVSDATCAVPRITRERL